jgi:tetratricopeptide (TPR) repeat protein
MRRTHEDPDAAKRLSRPQEGFHRVSRRWDRTSRRRGPLPSGSLNDMTRRFSVLAATVLATVAVMSSAEIAAQTLKEWGQCSAGEGKAVDVVISACSAIIQVGQDGPRRLAMAFNNRGAAYKLKGDYDRALKDYEQAILFNPNFANAYNNRGVIYGLKGDYDRAIREYGEAISLDKKFSAAFYNRASAHLEKVDLDRALDDFAAILRFNAKNALALYGRGVVRLKKGDPETGAADIAAAKAIDPKVVEEFERSRTR